MNNLDPKKFSVFIFISILFVAFVAISKPVFAEQSAELTKEVLIGNCSDNAQPSLNEVTPVNPNYIVLAEQILGTRPSYELTAEQNLYGVRSNTTRYYTTKVKRGQNIYYCLGERYEVDRRFAGSAEKNVIWKNIRGSMIQGIVYFYDPQDDSRPLVALGLNSKTVSSLNFSQSAFVDQSVKLDTIDEITLQQLFNKIDEISFSTKGEDKSFVIRNISSLGSDPSYELISSSWGKRYVVGVEEPINKESLTEAEQDELMYALGLKENRLNRLQVSKETRSGVLVHYAHVCVNYNLCQEVTGVLTEKPWSEIIYKDLNNKIIGRHTIITSTHSNYRNITHSWFNGRGLDAIGFQVATYDYQYDLNNDEIISMVLKIPKYYRWLYICGERIINSGPYSCEQSSFVELGSNFSAITPQVKDILLGALKKVPGGTTVPLVVLKNYKEIDSSTISFDLMINDNTGTKYSFINEKRQR